MKRSLLLLALLYFCGDARLEAYRPGLFDRTLLNFHRTVDEAFVDLRRALTDANRVARVINDARTMQYLEAGLRQLKN